MQTTAAPTMLPHLWKAALVSGLLAVILGVLVFVRPATAIFVTAIFFGAYLLITGVSQVILAFSVRSAVAGRLLLLIGGAAALVLAVLCFINPSNSIQLLAIWIGIGLIFRGVATSMSAIGDPAMPGRIWEIVLGIISLIAGAVILAWPLEGLVAVTRAAGTILVVIGLFEIVSAFIIRKASKNIGAALSPPPAAESAAAPE
jgi:uncharacterized membrane protein HdeD (DUF308 family)